MQRYGKDTTRIDTRVGERVLIELPVMATAGYRWVATWGSDVAELARAETRPGGPVGAKSIHEIELVAARPGTGTLRLEYKRPWENVEGERRSIEIVVAA